jgi:hypothetical protein
VRDARVLLNAFEKEYDLPAVFGEADGCGSKAGVVGQEDQCLAFS